MSRHMTWRYHATKAPKMVPMDDAEQLERLEAEGWADTPAKFDAPEPDTEQGDLEHMTKDDLLALARSMELDVSTRTAKADLIAAIVDAQE